MDTLISESWVQQAYDALPAACRYFKSLPDGATREKKLSRNERACP